MLFSVDILDHIVMPFSETVVILPVHRYNLGRCMYRQLHSHVCTSTTIHTFRQEMKFHFPHRLPIISNQNYVWVKGRRVDHTTTRLHACDDIAMSRETEPLVSGPTNVGHQGQIVDIKNHKFLLHYFNQFTFCGHCGNFIW